MEISVPKIAPARPPIRPPIKMPALLPIHADNISAPAIVEERNTFTFSSKLEINDIPALIPVRIPVKLLNIFVFFSTCTKSSAVPAISNMSPIAAALTSNT